MLIRCGVVRGWGNGAAADEDIRGPAEGERRGEGCGGLRRTAVAKPEKREWVLVTQDSGLQRRAGANVEA